MEYGYVKYQIRFHSKPNKLANYVYKASNVIYDSIGFVYFFYFSMNNKLRVFLGISVLLVNEILSYFLLLEIKKILLDIARVK